MGLFDNKPGIVTGSSRGVGRWRKLVGVDKAQDAGMPVTMSAYAIQGILAQLEYLRYLDG